MFRKEALEHRDRGLQREGDVLRISPAWTGWTYWLLVALLGMGVLYSVVGTLSEYASGPALVRMEGRTDLTALENAVVATVEVQPGQRVQAGQVLVTFVAEGERGALARIRREFELQLVRFLRDPSDGAARQALTSLRAERELAETRIAARTLKAPFASVVGDLRIQPGQYLTAGTRVLSLLGSDRQVFLLAFLPGYYRPFLRPGTPLRVELEGFRYGYQQLYIESVGDQIIGPNELHRYLGADLADAVQLQGPIVLVRARFPSSSLLHEGEVFNYFDGMPARAEARVRSESLALVLIPGLKALFSHDE